DEVSVSERYAACFTEFLNGGDVGKRSNTFRKGFRRSQAYEEIGKVGHLEQGSDDRCDDVTHQRLYHGSESGTKHDTHGHVHHIALDGKFFEVFYHSHIEIV